MTVALSARPAIEVVERIIRGQERVVGKAAWKVAKRVRSLSVARDQRITIASGVDDADVIEQLVREFTVITGELGARMCFMSAADILRMHPELDIPSFRGFARLF